MTEPAKQSADILTRDDPIGHRISGVKELQWALARLLFHFYIGFSLLTVVGGFLTAPVMTYYFFGDWRFWRHWNTGGWRLFPHGYSMLWRIVRGESGYMLDVPLTSPPHSAPHMGVVRLNPTWEHGYSCGECSRCCEKISCPVLDAETGLCRGYDSFFWRYFNCGRFPSAQREIDYYDCPKWEMQPSKDRRAGRVA